MLYVTKVRNLLSGLSQKECRSVRRCRQMGSDERRQFHTPIQLPKKSIQNTDCL